jgi:hypothetical protein
MTAMRKKEHTELILKQCTLLLEEFKLGVYTVETYREAIAKLENIDKAVAPSSSPMSRARSPSWDILGDDLPEDDDDLYV